MTKKTSELKEDDLAGLIAGVILRSKIDNKEKITDEERKKIIIASFGIAKGLKYFGELDKSNKKLNEDDKHE